VAVNNKAGLALSCVNFNLDYAVSNIPNFRAVNERNNHCIGEQRVTAFQVVPNVFDVRRNLMTLSTHANDAAVPAQGRPRLWQTAIVR
jgi:hypothetical protein